MKEGAQEGQAAPAHATHDLPILPLFSTLRLPTRSRTAGMAGKSSSWAWRAWWNMPSSPGRPASVICGLAYVTTITDVTCQLCRSVMQDKHAATACYARHFEAAGIRRHSPHARAFIDGNMGALPVTSYRCCMPNERGRAVKEEMLL